MSLKFTFLVANFLLFLTPALAAKGENCQRILSVKSELQIKVELSKLISELQAVDVNSQSSLREILHNEIQRKLREFESKTGKSLNKAELKKLIQKNVQKKEQNEAQRKRQNDIEVKTVQVDKQLSQTHNLRSFGVTAEGQMVLWDGKFLDADLNVLPDLNQAYSILQQWVPTRPHDIKLGTNYNPNLVAIQSQHQGVIVVDGKNKEITRLGQGFLFRNEPLQQLPQNSEPGIFIAGTPRNGQYVAVYHNHLDQLAIWNPNTKLVEKISKSFTNEEAQATSVSPLENQVVIHYFDLTYLYDLKTKRSKKLKGLINPQIVILPGEKELVSVQETDHSLTFQVRSAIDFNIVIKEQTLPRPKGWWDIVGHQLIGDMLYIQSRRAVGNPVTATIDLKTMQVSLNEGLAYHLPNGIQVAQNNQPGASRNEYLIFGPKMIPTPILADEIHVNVKTNKIYAYERQQGLSLLSLDK